MTSWWWFFHNVTYLHVQSTSIIRHCKDMLNVDEIMCTNTIYMYINIYFHSHRFINAFTYSKRSDLGVIQLTVIWIKKNNIIIVVIYFGIQIQIIFNLVLPVVSMQQSYKWHVRKMIGSLYRFPDLYTFCFYGSDYSFILSNWMSNQ